MHFVTHFLDRLFPFCHWSEIFQIYFQLFIAISSHYSVSLIQIQALQNSYFHKRSKLWNSLPKAFFSFEFTPIPLLRFTTSSLIIQITFVVCTVAIQTQLQYCAYFIWATVNSISMGTTIECANVVLWRSNIIYPLNSL